MIIETLITWILNVLNGAMSLLPTNGHALDNLPYFMNSDGSATSARSVSFSFLKVIGVAENYVPVNEIGRMFVIMLSAYGVLWIAELVITTYRLVTDVLP